jgi:radical SAM protein with 4Fe4S-binding SPASM domain
MKQDVFLNHASLCALPWSGVFVNPNGNVKNCAISGEVIGDINQTPIDKIVNNNVNQTIRTDMLNGLKQRRCNPCYSVENNSTAKISQSNRSWYKQVAIKNISMDIFDSPENFELNVLDLRWRNTCNFACVYCGPDLSSHWASLMDDTRWTIGEQNLKLSKDYIFNHLDTVKHVYLAGGEPLLMKDNHELLTHLYKVNPDVEIRINSNISNIHGPVFNQLQKFKNVKWTISVESTEAYFEYMRWPGKWDEFVKNALTIKQYVGDQINFNMVWCILNPFEIFETFDFLIDQGFHENMFVVQCLTDPTPLSVLHLPSEHIQDLKNKILRRLENANPQWWLYKSLDSMYNFLSHSAPKFKTSFQTQSGSDGIKGTIEFLKKIDIFRNTESRHLFKELYHIHDSL